MLDGRIDARMVAYKCCLAATYFVQKYSTVLEQRDGQNDRRLTTVHCLKE